MQPTGTAVQSGYASAPTGAFRAVVKSTDTVSAPRDSVQLGAPPREERLDRTLAKLGARPLTQVPIDTRETLNLQAHALQRPVIMVHGLGQQSDTWFGLKNFLCSAPENRFGGIYRADDEQGFIDQVAAVPGANMFAIDMTDSLAHPQQQATELASMITLVKRLTGTSQVDVVTHSMGGIVAREYLHQGHRDLDRLVMIAPPNHGSAVADLGLSASRLGFEHYPPDRQEALGALRTQNGLFGGERNAYLADLERAWPTDSAGVETTIIAGAGFPTPTRRFAPVGSGDGLLTPESARLEGANLFVAQPFDASPGTPGYRDFERIRYTHWQMLSEPAVLQKVDAALSAPPATA